MENSLYVGLSKQLVLNENMSIIANNVANMTSPGFRGQNMIFTEFISDPRGQDEPVSFVLDYGQYQMTDPGPVKETGNPLDVALVGPGFLGVQTADGIQYTRAGNLSLNNDGEIVNARGLPMADTGGATITIPADAREIKIDQNGIVSTEDGEVGQLMMVEFDNYQTLDPNGNGLYTTDEAAIPATETTMVQGKVEGSNVQPIVEMTRMISVLREYQAVQRIMQSEHDRLRTAIQRMSRTNQT